MCWGCTPGVKVEGGVNHCVQGGICVGDVPCVGVASGVCQCVLVQDDHGGGEGGKQYHQEMLSGMEMGADAVLECVRLGMWCNTHGVGMRKIINTKRVWSKKKYGYGNIWKKVISWKCGGNSVPKLAGPSTQLKGDNKTLIMGHCTLDMRPGVHGPNTELSTNNISKKPRDIGD